MAVIKEGIILNENNTISFGNYEVTEKLKVKDFVVDGDIYKVRTHNLVTRLSKNSQLLLETVPGATVHNLNVAENKTSFELEGAGDISVTLELEPETNYSLYIDDVNLDKVKTNKSGKINFSTSVSKDVYQVVKIEKN